MPGTNESLLNEYTKIYYKEPVIGEAVEIQGIANRILTAFRKLGKKQLVVGDNVYDEQGLKVALSSLGNKAAAEDFASFLGLGIAESSNSKQNTPK